MNSFSESTALSLYSLSLLFCLTIDLPQLSIASIGGFNRAPDLTIQS